MVEQITDREKAEYGGEEDQSWKDRQNEVVRQSRGDLKRMVSNQILVRIDDGALDATDAHAPKIVRVRWSEEYRVDGIERALAAHAVPEL